MLCNYFYDQQIVLYEKCKHMFVNIEQLTGIFLIINVQKIENKISCGTHPDQLSNQICNIIVIATDRIIL